MISPRARRSSTVVIAVTMQRLLEDPTRSWTTEEALVLDALRRSTTALADASPEELAAYLSGLNPQQLRGVMSNVKGIYHELLFVHAENVDDDDVSARVFDVTNHPGADVEFIVDGNVIGEVQLKAVASPAAILEHIQRYPGIDAVATDEIATRFSEVTSSGFSNVELTDNVTDRLNELRGDSFADNVVDGVATSALVGAAFASGRAIRHRQFSREELRTTLGDMATGGVTAALLDLLLGNVT